jgi:hypothetical protein
MLEYLVKCHKPTFLAKCYEVTYDVLLFLNYQNFLLLSVLFSEAANS